VRFNALTLVSSRTSTAMRTIHIPPVILATAAVAALYGWAVVAVTPFHPGSMVFARRSGPVIRR